MKIMNAPFYLKNASNLSQKPFFFVKIIIKKTNVSNLMHVQDKMVYFNIFVRRSEKEL